MNCFRVGEEYQYQGLPHIAAEGGKLLVKKGLSYSLEVTRQGYAFLKLENGTKIYRSKTRYPNNAEGSTKLEDYINPNNISNSRVLCKSKDLGWHFLYANGTVKKASQL